MEYPPSITDVFTEATHRDMNTFYINSRLNLRWEKYQLETIAEIHEWWDI